MAVDEYKESHNRTEPLTAVEVIDISSADHAITFLTRGLYVGTAGDVKVDMPGSAAVTLPNLAAGVWHPIRVSKVYKVGTTADEMIAGT